MGWAYAYSNYINHTFSFSSAFDSNAKSGDMYMDAMDTSGYDRQ